MPYVMKFNGVDSKLDCGTPSTLVGDKTFVAWIKPASLGEVKGRIFDNGKLIIAMLAPGRFQYSSNGFSTSASSSSNLYDFGEWVMIGLVRQGSGICNFYAQGVLAAPADQNSGTPVAGSTNLIIGNNNATTATFDGLIDGPVRIIDGLLTAAEISQLSTESRQRYSQ